MNLIDGKAVSASVKEQIRAEIERDKLDIGLAVIIVGNNQASRVYVNNKKNACEVCGIKSYEYALPEDTTQAYSASCRFRSILTKKRSSRLFHRSRTLTHSTPLMSER